LKALSIKPPLHPIFPKEPEQETSYYSEKSPSSLSDKNLADSDEATAEKAQQDPHYP